MSDLPEGAPISGSQTELNPEQLLASAVRSLADKAPAEWKRLDGIFSLAGDEEAMQVVASTAHHSYSVPIDPDVADMIRRHRTVSIDAQGPWLRLTFECDRSGDLRVGLDYGAIELSSDYLLSGEAYRQDIARYPRPVPLWLLAHMNNDGRQLRSAAKARTSVALNPNDAVSVDDLPPLPTLWARIAVLAAVGRGSNAANGAICDPSYQRFQGESGGCLLARLHGKRGVLSGGYDDSRLLSAAYQGAITWPDFYHGAPAWVHNLYLDPRAAAGRMSFCYWWFGGRWYRADLGEMTGVSDWSYREDTLHGMPDVGTAAAAATQVAVVLLAGGAEVDERRALDLVVAAESRSVTDEHLTALFPDGVPGSFDIAEALAQLEATDVLYRR